MGSIGTEDERCFQCRFLTVKTGTSPVPGHPLYPDSNYYGNNTATANILPLAFGLVPKPYIPEVVKNVVTAIITKNGGHICCGCDRSTVVIA